MYLLFYFLLTICVKFKLLEYVNYHCEDGILYDIVLNILTEKKYEYKYRLDFS